jgi:hypothetical protein
MKLLRDRHGRKYESNRQETYSPLHLLVLLYFVLRQSYNAFGMIHRRATRVGRSTAHLRRAALCWESAT